MVPSSRPKYSAIIGLISSGSKSPTDNEIVPECPSTERVLVGVAVQVVDPADHRPLVGLAIQNMAWNCSWKMPESIRCGVVVPRERRRA